MPRIPLNALRTVAVLAVMVVMPLLAAPQVRYGWRSLLQAPATAQVEYIDPSRWLSAEQSPASAGANRVQVVNAENRQLGGDQESTFASSAAWPVRLPGAAEKPRDPIAPLPLASDARLQEIQQQLRRMGAEQMQLEAANAQENLYRFRCQFAAARGDAQNRLFEATDANPLRAMQRVLAQAKDWRSAARPAAPLSRDEQRTLR